MTDSANFFGDEQQAKLKDSGHEILNAETYSDAQFRLAQTLAERFRLPSYAQWEANMECRYDTLPRWWWNATKRRKQFIAQIAGHLAWLERQASINAGNARLDRLITGAAE